ncbi:SDR family oxidoreductase [Psychroserpens sp. S379A]|uniref:SDR family oxidoreductase n=1 Tax=Psychroserpens sp. S379A TaxID=3415137 RepID=UPI003C7E4537
MKFKNKTAIVTGAGSGIGKAVAEHLGRQGANVVINYYSDDQISNTQTSISKIKSNGGQAIAVKADVSNLNELKALFETTKTTFGSIDIVINNAVLPVLKPIAEVTEAEFDAMFNVNVKSVFFAQQLCATMMNNGGRIINLSSHTTFLFFPNYGLYDGTKGAVEQITRVFSKEIGHKGITANVVSPGATDTAEFATRPQELKDRVSAMSAMNRIAKVDEVVNVISFLASDEASWVTGQNIKVNGGAV